MPGPSNGSFGQLNGPMRRLRTCFALRLAWWLFHESFGRIKPPRNRLKQFILCTLPKPCVSYPGAGFSAMIRLQISKTGRWFTTGMVWHVCGGIMLRLVLGVEVAAWALVSPVDVERGLVLYSNDDRGMDVGAHDKADLEEIDHWRKPWRLVRSRLQMDALFAADGDAI